ncbi:MAG: hypothetical protein WB523_05890 [Candidatus Sulfotelmatobacter sp.]
MKLKVNRQLSGGLYHVDFSVGDFSSEEVAKMGSFGTPIVSLLSGNPDARKAFKVRVTQVSPNYKASFVTDEEAKQYEEDVVTAIRNAMKAIRERSDDFTSTQEVDI